MSEPINGGKKNVQNAKIAILGHGQAEKTELLLYMWSALSRIPGIVLVSPNQNVRSNGKSKGISNFFAAETRMPMPEPETTTENQVSSLILDELTEIPFKNRHERRSENKKNKRK